MGWLLETRHRSSEIMDQPGLGEAQHLQALRALARVNLVSRSGPRLWAEIRDASRLAGLGTIRVLDLACGGGDIVRDLALRSRAAGLDLQIDGADRSGQAVEYAQKQAVDHQLSSRFFVLDVLKDPIPTDYDILTCTLFLHHLDEGDVVDLLRRMSLATKKMMLVDDLIRSAMGYLMAQIGCRLLTRSPVVHYDGPVSVAGAFRLEEVRGFAQDAGLSGARIVRHWPERFLLSWSRPR